MFTRTMPAFAVANCVSAHSAQFGAQMPTRSPTSSPAATSARARRSACASSSAYVSRVPWWREMSAGWSGSSCATRSRSAPIVSPMSGLHPTPLAYEGAMSGTLPPRGGGPRHRRSAPGQHRLREGRAVDRRGVREIVAGDERDPSRSAMVCTERRRVGSLDGREPERLDARVLGAQPGGVGLDPPPGGDDALRPLPLAEVGLRAGAVVGVDAAAAVRVRGVVRLGQPAPAALEDRGSPGSRSRASPCPPSGTGCTARGDARRSSAMRGTRRPG